MLMKHSALLIGTLRRVQGQARWFAAVCLTALLLVSCGGSSQGNVAQTGLPMKLIYLISEEKEVVAPVAVELALTDEQRSRGLQFREFLPRERGMLFIFENEEPRSFWMKDTLIPLDIIFFNGSGSYVSSASMTPCTEDPCQKYPSAGPAKYALEVVAGFTEQVGVGEGWKMAF